VTSWPAPTTLSLGREALAVYDYGPPSGDSRGDVVLLHGMADVARSLEPLARSLIDRYRVVAFDARGHGRSTHPGAYSGMHFVADLVGLVDAIGMERPILIGHSLGGHTVANYSGIYPDRVRAAVLLEGLGPPSAPPPDTAPAELERARAMIDVLRSLPRHRPQPDIAAATARLTTIHTRLDPDRADQIRDNLDEHVDRVVDADIDDVKRAHRHHLRRHFGHGRGGDHHHHDHDHDHADTDGETVESGLT